MRNKLGLTAAMVSWMLWALMAASGALVLSGCAGSTASMEKRADLMTESDEPETRKRARIRLELAVGYFDKGQTTVALDEVKQAIAADPGFMQAYNLRGLVYMRLGDPALAEESFRKALDIQSDAAPVQHNLGWLMCQQGRFADAQKWFTAALANPNYGDRAKTWMTLGLCQSKNKQLAEAEASLLHSYELDASNPITAYNLSLLLFQRGEFVRAQFYVRRLNNSDLANAESLWLGIKVERRIGNTDAMAQLGAQLHKRFPQSREVTAFDRGAFDE